jgi:hypothetical protein
LYIFLNKPLLCFFPFIIMQEEARRAEEEASNDSGEDDVDEYVVKPCAPTPVSPPQDYISDSGDEGHGF